MQDFKTILVAIDFSSSSDNAFQMALGMAKKYAAKLVVLHVINEPVDMRGFYVPHISFEKLEEEIEQGAKKMMDAFEADHLTDYDNHECLILPGMPHELIIDQATKKGADLIVMGTHGRTGLDHVLFGSTAEKVVRKAKTPVLTARLMEE